MEAQAAQAHEAEIPTWRQQAYNTEEAMGGSVNRLTGKVEALEAKPGKRWDGLLDKALLVLCGTFVAWLASGAPGL